MNAPDTIRRPEFDEPDPPHNYEAEQRLLGAIFVNNRVYDHIRSSTDLLPEHFYQPLHGRIYSACKDQIEKGRKADPVSLNHVFSADQELAQLGGTSYLARLATSAVTVAFADHYAKIIFDLFLRRELIRLGQSTVRDALAPSTTREAAAQIEALDTACVALMGNSTAGEMQPIATAVARSLEITQEAYRAPKGSAKGVPTGISALDRLLVMKPGKFIIAAGRTGMGKTVFAVNAALGAARHFAAEARETEGRIKTVGIVSAEMQADELATSFLANLTGIAIDKQEHGDLDDNDWQRMLSAQRDLDALPISISDRAMPSIGEIRARARWLARARNLGLLIVDHVGLVRATDKKMGPTERVTEVSNTLKMIAKECGCPVLGLAQINRSVEGRDNRRPQLSDLKQSGSLEEDADAVILLYRAEYYLERETPPATAKAEVHEIHDRLLRESRNVLEAHVAKQRRGPSATAKLYFSGATSRIRDWQDADAIENQGGFAL